MSWEVLFHDEFDAEFEALTEEVQDNLPAAAKALQIAGPKAGRPHVDTLDGSKHANMKELRFTALPRTAAVKSGGRFLRLILAGRPLCSLREISRARIKSYFTSG